MIIIMKSVRAHIALPLLNHQMKKALTMNVREARNFFEKNTRSKKWPKVFRVFDDIISKTPIRIYTNKQSSSHGVMIFIHGGGFSLGSIESHDSIARLLCKSTRQTVISVGYNLAPEYKHPSPVIETLNVINHLKELSKKYSFDLNHVTLCGDSAGGFIALHTALRTNVSIDSLILIYPMILPHAKTESMKKYSTKHFVTASNIRAFWKLYISSEPITPLTQHTIDLLPPTLIITAEYDVLRDEAHDLYTLMRNQGKACQYNEAKGRWHGFLHWPTVMGGRTKTLAIIKKFIAMHQTR